eukprot:6457745-Amphidinium_carterae.1
MEQRRSSTALCSQESIRWWDDTTSKSPMEFERGDDTVVDTSRGTELEGHTVPARSKTITLAL